MRALLIFVVGILPGLLMSCALAADKSEPEPTRPPTLSTNDCPGAADLKAVEGWQTGDASYRAVRSGDEVAVFAEGMTSTPGYRIQFAQLADGKLGLYFKRPTGIQLQVLKPFKVCVRTKAAAGQKQITVVDRQGNHAVAIQ